MQPIIVKGRQVQLLTTPSGEVSTPASVCGAAEPVVRLLREGGVVYAIEMRCACGRPTVVQLDYEQTASVPASTPSELSPTEPSPTEASHSEPSSSEPSPRKEVE